MIADRDDGTLTDAVADIGYGAVTETGEAGINVLRDSVMSLLPRE